MNIKFLPLVAVLFLCFTFACNSSQSEKKKEIQTSESEDLAEQETTLPKEEKFGEEITDENAISVTEIPTLLTKQDSAEVKVVGTIAECCQKKGCWLKVPISEGEEMFVRFKDYGFFAPMDSEGKQIVMEGKVKKEVIPVAQLRHYAEDAGKSAEEIEKITEDEVKISFLANGIIIRN